MPATEASGGCSSKNKDFTATKLGPEKWPPLLIFIWTREEKRVEKLTVLGIGAHADPFDMAFLCGGTFAKYAKNGHRAVIASVCGENQVEGNRVAGVVV